VLFRWKLLVGVTRFGSFVDGASITSTVSSDDWSENWAVRSAAAR
jgi:hypothetical protein